MKEKYSIKEFCEIIEQLRGENGCPWDREQTHESLRACMMEEAAELVASVRILKETGNCENLREELGDVLLQVILHSQIAKEEGYFTLDDVVTEISRKMIRRHPHVFGSAVADTKEAVVSNWDEIKRSEKSGMDATVAELSDLPLELPALVRAQKLSRKAEKVYGKKENYKESLDHTKKLLHEWEEHGGDLSPEQQNKVIGELLYSLSDMAQRKGIHAEQALSDVVTAKIGDYQTFVKEN